jgi:hypothetical protein
METGIGFSSSYCAPDLPNFYFSKPLKQNRLTSMISASFSRNCSKSVFHVQIRTVSYESPAGDLSRAGFILNVITQWVCREVPYI